MDQSNFAALSLAPVETGLSSQEGYLYKTFLLQWTKGNVGAVPPSAVVLPEFPYRICAVTESFSSLLGFNAKELTNSSLRLVFGPQTDLKGIKKIICEDSADDSVFLLYKRNGDEIRCSIASRVSSTPENPAISTITIVCHESESIRTVRSAMQENTDQQSFSEPVGTSGFSTDPALRAHLNAIRRLRRVSLGH